MPAGQYGINSQRRIANDVLLCVGVSPAEGAVATDAVTTAYSAIVKRAEIKKDQTVVLFGLGGLGFNALQVLLWIGAKVIVSDTREATLREAVKLGVPQEDIVPVGTPVTKFVRERGLENKIDTVADFVGMKQTFNDAQNIGKSNLSPCRPLEGFSARVLLIQ